MTKDFSKWLKKQDIQTGELSNALDEIMNGSFEANLGGNLVKKRVRFRGKGKSGSGRTIVCYRHEDIAIYIHGFAKNEKSNVSAKELIALKELSKVLLGLSPVAVTTAIENGDFIEVEEL